MLFGRKLYRSTIVSTLGNLVRQEFPLRICHFSRLRIFSKFSVFSLCVTYIRTVYVPTQYEKWKLPENRFPHLFFFPFFFPYFFLFYSFFFLYFLSNPTQHVHVCIQTHDISLRSHFYTKKFIYSYSTYQSIMYTYIS